MTATAAPTVARLGRLDALRVAHDTVRHGLRTDGPLIRAADDADLLRFRFNRRTTLVLRHPDAVDHVLFAAPERYHKSLEYELLRSVAGLSLFTDEDDSWRRHRMLLNPVLAKRHLTSLFDLMVAPVEAFLDRVDDTADGDAVDLSQAMTELTLDVVGNALFGRSMGDLARRIGPTVTTGLHAAEQMTRVILLLNPPIWTMRATASFVRSAPLLPPQTARIQRVMRTIDETVWDVINHRRAHPGREDDLLGLLLSVRDEEGRPLPMRRVRDEATTFMLAGHETTANALAWMWFLLAGHDDARQQLLDEVDTVLGDRHPTMDDMARLPWTTACFLEAMRLYPPAWAIPRVCVDDDEILGEPIRRGENVLIPIDLLHHDPRLWPDPDAYDPRRFLPDAPRPAHRCAYLPFGGGRRVCIGQSFATIEATLITAMMSRRWIYDLIPGEQVMPEATLTLRPRGGLRLRARRRVPASPGETSATGSKRTE